MTNISHDNPGSYETKTIKSNPDILRIGKIL